MEAVEVAMKTEVVLGPNALEHLDELFRATIALIVFQPRLANGPKLVLEPARHDIDRDPLVGELVDGGQLFGRQHRTPGPWQDGSDHFELLGGGQQSVADGHRLMLIFGAITGCKTDL